MSEKPEKYKPHTLDGDRSPEVKVPFQILSRTEKSDSHNVREIQCHLEQINEQLLEELFVSELNKAGLDTRITNFVPLRTIEVIDVVDFPELFDNMDVSLTFGATETSPDGHRIIVVTADEATTHFAHTLWIVIHEELHAVSTQIRTGVSYESSYSGVGEVEEADSESEFRKHNCANEGITELITNRIFSEYCVRTGILSSEDRKFGNRLSPDNYKCFTQIMQFYAGLLEMISGVELGAGEDALVRAYLRNGTLLPDEVVDALNNRAPQLAERLGDLLSDEFMENYRHLGDFVRPLTQAVDWTTEELSYFKTLEQRFNHGRSTIAMSEIFAQFRKKV